jgi:hypothetical protein
MLLRFLPRGKTGVANGLETRTLILFGREDKSLAVLQCGILADFSEIQVLPQLKVISMIWIFVYSVQGQWLNHG